MVQHLSNDGIFSVKVPDGDVYKLTQVTKVSDNDEEGVDDILQLRDFSEMSLIHTLRVRYLRDEIYTFVGPILVSLNPYKYIKGIYSEDAMVEYHSQKQPGELPPHLFALADNAYTSLMNSKNSSRANDQSIIISGTMRICITHLYKEVPIFALPLSTQHTYKHTYIYIHTHIYIHIYTMI